MSTETPEPAPVDEPVADPQPVEPTPEPTPEADPTATPEPTPESAPETTPEPAPSEVTVEPTPQTEQAVGSETPAPTPLAQNAVEDPRTRAERRRAERLAQLDAGTTPTHTAAEQISTDLELNHEEKAQLKTLPTAQLATDAQGTDRIVVPDLNAEGWRPAPLEPDPVEVARLEKLSQAIEAQNDARKKVLGLA